MESEGYRKHLAIDRLNKYYDPEALMKLKRVVKVAPKYHSFFVLA